MTLPAHSFRKVTAATCAFALCLGAAADAANQTWNPAGAGGGAGSWNANNWDSAAAWVAGNTAIFGGTPGNVTLNSTTQTTGGLTFNVGGYTLSTGTLSFNGAPTTITTSGGTTTFASTLSLSGAGGSQITKTGAGTLATSTSNTGLGTGANPVVWTVTGGTLSSGVYDSVLSISAGNNLGFVPSAPTLQVILDQGTLMASGNVASSRRIQVNAAGGTLQIVSATGTQTVDGNITNNADSNHTFYLNSTSSFMGGLNGVISGSGSVTKVGIGALYLNNASTYSGGTTISAGTLQLRNTTALGNTAGTLTVDGGTLDLNGNNQGVGNFTGSGGTLLNALNATNVTLTIGNADGTGGDYAGVIANNGGGAATGTVALTKTGTGTLTFSGTNANTYTGTTIVNGGTLTLGKTAGVNAIVGNITLGDGTGSDVLLLSASNQIADTSIITFNGSAVNNRGVLRLNNQNEIIGGLSGTGTNGVVENGNPTVAGSSILTVNVVSGTQSFGGELRDNSGISSLALTKSGAGTQTLTGANTYTGPTNVIDGTLLVSGSISGSTSVSMTGGSLLLSGTAGEQINDDTALGLGGGTLGFNNAANQIETLGALTLSANSTLDFGTSGGNDSFKFAGLASHTAGTVLTIQNWFAPNMNGSTDGAGDRLFFTGPSTDFTNAFNQADVSFSGFGPGYGVISFGPGTGTSYEIVAVPEPSSTGLLGCAALLGLVGYRKRRRFGMAQRRIS